MSLQLQIEERPGYLAARFTGAGVIEEVGQEFELIAEHCKRTNKNKLLLDFTGAHADVSLANLFLLAERTQIFVRYNLKIAACGRTDQIDPQKFGELVARNRGVNGREFTDVEAAEEWLLE